MEWSPTVQVSLYWSATAKEWRINWTARSGHGHVSTGWVVAQSGVPLYPADARQLAEAIALQLEQRMF